MSLSNRLTLPVKIALAPAFALALFLLFGALCWWLLKAQEQRINVDLTGRLHVLQTIDESERKLGEAHSTLYRALAAVRINTKQDLIDKVLKSHKSLASEAHTLLAQRIDDDSLDAGGRGLRGEALRALRDYTKTAKDAADAADMDINVADMSMQGADQKFLALSKQLGVFSAQQKALTEDARKAVSKAQRDMLIALVVALAAAVLLTALVSLLITRAILKQINTLAGAMKRCAEGDLNVEIETQGRDQVADLCRGLATMRDNLRARIERDARVTAEMLRIKNALDKCNSNVMVADRDGMIVYMNEAVQAMLARNEADIRKTLPHFDARHIAGRSMDVFEHNPAHQKNLPAGQQGAHKTPVRIGELHFSMIASPVLDESNQRVGTVVEWKDRTAEVRIEEEVAAIVKAASEGDFTRQVALEGKYGFFKVLAESLNQLMQTSDKGLNDVVRVLGALAKGDLTEKISNDYQGTFGRLKSDANQTVENLTVIVNQLKEASETIDMAAKEISQGNIDLSQRTEEQASSLEETASSMEELTSTVKQNAENARQANQLAVGASDVAVKGGDVVKQVVSTMSGITESSKKIADIIGVIDGIAFQTNILALNAAVEAARAGEQGRGFAVVATEVRNLAQRSANAAKEIKALITDSVNRVDAGSKLVGEAGSTMDEVVASVKRVTDIMAEITAASQEQSSGIEQVNQAITQMDEVTQQNAALVEQAAAAAESMQEQAGSLVQTVATFSLGQESEGAQKLERRTPNRAVNVARLPARAGKAASKPMRNTAGNTPVLKKVAGGDEDWQEF